MKSESIRKAYDKGYDAGMADAGAQVRGRTVNPYKRIHPTRSYGWFGYWERGYEDGFNGRKRKITQDEADRRARARLALLEDVYKAAEALNLCEDFDEMPCQHEDCAPADWDAYQATRKRLYDALVAAREPSEER